MCFFSCDSPSNEEAEQHSSCQIHNPGITIVLSKHVFKRLSGLPGANENDDLNEEFFIDSV